MGIKSDDTDWFRSSTWSPEIEADFDRRLQRAREYNRAQYVRIQGVHLDAQDDPALHEIARKLFRRVLRDYPLSIDCRPAREHLADSLAADGLLTDAASVYREVIARNAVDPIRSGGSGIEALSFAETLYRIGSHESLAEAWRVLDLARQGVESQRIFRNTVLRYYVCRARIARALRDKASAATFAGLALEVAAETEPSLRYHPDLGRPNASAELMRELLRLARKR